MPFCLPVEKVNKLAQAVKAGVFNPTALEKMTTEERSAFLENLVGNKTEAKGINTLFEKEFKQASLGGKLNLEESQGIIDKTKALKEAKSEAQKNPDNVEDRIKYGQAKRNLNEYTNSLKPKNSQFTVGNVLLEAGNISKTLVTAFHMSEFLNSGLFSIGTKEWWQGIAPALKSMASEKFSTQFNDAISGDPYYDRITKTFPALLSKFDNSIKGDVEESIPSQVLDKIPGIKNFNRAYSNFLNGIRFYGAKNLIIANELAGNDMSMGSENLKDAVMTVANATSRGELGANDRMAATQKYLNATIFSPRKLSALVGELNPYSYIDPGLTLTTRIARLQRLAGATIAAGTMIGIFNATTGGKTSLNPISADFGRAQDPSGTTYDPTAGASTLIRSVAQFALNQKQSASGKTTKLGQGYKPETRADIFFNYFTDKASPIASAFLDWARSTTDAQGNNPKTPYGQPLTVSGELTNLFVPIAGQDFIDMVNNDPNSINWLVPLAASLGIGVNVPSKK